MIGLDMILRIAMPAGQQLNNTWIDAYLSKPTEKGRPAYRVKSTFQVNQQLDGTTHSKTGQLIHSVKCSRTL